jgi:sugar phosphate permease
VTERHYPGAYVVWIVALMTYLIAVFHRSSLAVAGIVAAERFDINAAQLSTFVTLQLLVYAGMQIPVGIMVDRFGPRAVMLTGAIILTFAQLAFGLAESYSMALVARVFVGMGDAMTFICLLRLINSWFTPRMIPQVTTFTGPVGQLGAIAAAVPMTWALGTVGWTPAYVFSAILSLMSAIAVLALVRDDPTARSVRGEPLSWSGVASSLSLSWAEPGTRLGFWMHFTTQFSANMLGLLWGFPYFVQSEHASEHFAGLLLTILVVAVIIAGPILGRLITNHPWHRSTVVLVIMWAIVAVWTVTLCWPGDAPKWLLVVLVVVAGIGGPASMIGFDVVRTANPIERMGSATGIVNQGGFIATLLLLLAIGVILDWRTPPGSDVYMPEAFTWAMSAQYALWFVGMIQIWRYRRKSRTAYAHQVLS